MIYILYIYSLSLYIFTNNVIIPMVVCRLIFMTPVLSTLWYHWFQLLIQVHILAHVSNFYHLYSFFSYKDTVYLYFVIIINCLIICDLFVLI